MSSDASGYFSELRCQLDLHSGCNYINDVDFEELSEEYPVVDETNTHMQDIIKTYLERLNELVGNEDSFAANLSGLQYRHEFPPNSMLSDYEEFYENVIGNLLDSLDSEFDSEIQEVLDAAAKNI
jgi:hypothetical protein